MRANSSQDFPGAVPMQPVCQLQATARPTFYPEYKWRTSQILGISHLVIGASCVVFQSVAISEGAWGHDIGIGIWSGLVFIATGIFCICAAKRPSRGYILSVFLMSLLSCPMAFGATAVGILGAEEDNVSRYTVRVRVAMNAMLAMASLCEIFVAMWSSLIGGVVCCHNGDGGFDHCDSAACMACQCEECFSEPLLQDSPTLFTWQMNGPNGPQLVPMDQRTMPRNPNFIHLNPGFVQVNPGAMQMYPGTMQMSPGTMQMNPGTMQMNPGTMQMNPGTMQMNPGTMQINPGTMQMNPGNAPGNPFAAPIEPAAAAPVHCSDQYSSNITQQPTEDEKNNVENSPPPSYEESIGLSNI